MDENRFAILILRLTFEGVLNAHGVEREGKASMKGHRSPERRNRNIGTAKSGYGRDNELVVPGSRDARAFWERFRGLVSVKRFDPQGVIRVLVEPCRKGSLHAVTVDDIVELMSLIPVAERAPVTWVILRQPKKKEQVLDSVWGRYLPRAELGRQSGSAVILEAQTPGEPMRWPRSLGPSGRRELELLETEGHDIVTTRREYIVRSDREAIRTTQLYRTLPHEIGHSVQYQLEVNVPAGQDVCERERRLDLFRRKAACEKEDFAERYASAFAAQQRALGAIPFDRRLNPSVVELDGLDVSWFG